jgi:hypothetical protein
VRLLHWLGLSLAELISSNSLRGTLFSYLECVHKYIWFIYQFIIDYIKLCKYIYYIIINIHIIIILLNASLLKYKYFVDRSNARARS